MNSRPSIYVACAIALGIGSAAAATPESQLADYAKAAGAEPQAARGQAFFTARHGGQWSCATCHTEAPTVTGRHASTGKSIAPLAPAFDPGRFADNAKTEKWFRRNCKDVLGRECTPLEKADVLAWLLSLKS